jgi:photosystem II stability/assembly factor-like uncharacterized protein
VSATPTPSPSASTLPAAQAIPSSAATSQAAVDQVAPTPTLPAPGLPVQVSRTTEAVAADALDAAHVGAIVESCVGSACHDRLDLSSDGGRTWRRGPVMPRYGPDSRLRGLVGLDARHWYAYGNSGWFTSDAGVTWRRIRSGPVASAGRFGGDLWVVRVRCAKACSSAIDILDRAGNLVQADTPAFAAGFTVRDLLVVDGGLAASIQSGNTGRLVLLDSRLRPGLSRALPVPGGGQLVSVGAHSLDYLTAWDSSAGRQDKFFYRSDDSGRTWHRRPDPSSRGYAVALQAPAPGLLWRYGDRSELFRSTDDGHSWTSLLAASIGEAAAPLQAFASYGHSAWAFAFVADATVPAAWRTSDAGAHWSTVRVP